MEKAVIKVVLYEEHCVFFSVVYHGFCESCGTEIPTTPCWNLELSNTHILSLSLSHSLSLPL